MHSSETESLPAEKKVDVGSYSRFLARPKPHDITIFREDRSQFDTKQRFKGDKAYQGEDLIDNPIKKPRNGELTIKQKDENKNFYGKRIFVEHRIRSVKIF